MKRINFPLIQLFCFAFLVLGMPLFAGSAAGDTVQTDWDYLIGEWSAGANAGPSGEASGLAKFYYDLDKQVIIRESYASYPARGEQPAFTHKDRMIIYQRDKSPMAVYFDNEGHVINYRIHTESDGNAFVFVSDPSPNASQFRLTYKRIDAQSLDLIFEIAPPGQADAFNPYITSRLFRK